MTSPVVMSWIEALLFSFFSLLRPRRRKYFCACEATWVGVRVLTDSFAMLRQFLRIHKEDRLRHDRQENDGLMM